MNPSIKHDFTMTNCDTDSISFRKKDGSSFSEQEKIELLNEINSILPDMIEYEDDGYYEKFLVVKAKNYVTVENGKVKYKGSSILDQKKEPALREFLNTVIDCILENE